MIFNAANYQLKPPVIDLAEEGNQNPTPHFSPLNSEYPNFPCNTVR